MDVHLAGIFNSTDSIDYEEYNDYDSEDDDATTSVPVLIPIVCSVVLILGLFGNAVVMAALALRRQLWRVSDIFVLHLAVADLLLLLTLPIRAAQATRSSWSFGAFCKICGAVFHINFYCGLFGLLCISLDHYLCTNHKAKWRSMRKPSLAAFCCLLVWISSVFLSIPDWMFLASNKNQEQKLVCYYSYSQTKSHPMLVSRVFHHTVGFLLPVVVLMLLCSYYLPSLLWKVQGPQLRRRRPVIIICSLVLGFLLFWLPYNITLVLDTVLRRIPQTPPKKPHHLMASALLITSMFGYIHACLRPPIYLLCCKKFKNQVKKLLRFSNDETKGSLWELSLEEQCDQKASAEETKSMTDLQSQDQAH